MKKILYLLVVFLFVFQNLFAQQSTIPRDNKENVLTEKDLGDFPYIKLPEGYRFGDIKNRQFEEKYIFDNSGNVSVKEGKYFYASIFKDGETEFNETYVINFIKKQIEKYKGKLVYSGSIPDKAQEMIRNESPYYVKDLYDPMPYTYKQYHIRTKEANIWIELIHGLNAEQIDFTVLREELTE